MTFSSLASRAVPTSKYGTRGGAAVQRLIAHHTASTGDVGNVAYLSGDSGGTSSSYCLLSTGELVGIVPEEYRPWTSNAIVGGVIYDNDSNSVTVEVVNIGGAPNWPVADIQVETLARLAADLSTRHGWGKLNRSNVVGHREVLPAGYTTCPGPTLFPLLDKIVLRGNEILSGKTSEKPKKRKVSNMLGIKIVDGEKRYTRDGGVLYATVSGDSFVEISESDANAISGFLERNFANVTYAAWEAYKK